MGVCVSAARVRHQPLLPIHTHTRASVGREKMAMQARKKPWDSPGKCRANTAVGATRCSMLSPHSRCGTDAYNSKALVGSVWEGSLVSTFWSLSLRDKEESM